VGMMLALTRMRPQSEIAGEAGRLPSYA
jgi:hypothetical protein